MKKIGVKFCGGCNPKYDRDSIFLKVKEAYGEDVHIVEEGETYDALLSICGCENACADISKYKHNVLFINTDSQKVEVEEIKKFLKEK